MRKLKQITFLSFIFIITVAFNFQDNPPSNWTQQFLPPLGSQQVNDMVFIDSITGFVVTSINSNPDAATILKTTNGGDNWNVVFSLSPRRLTQIKFINSTTGFVTGGSGSGTPYLYKTTNKGDTWFIVPTGLGTALWEGISVLNEDTMWVVDHNSFNGGIFRTTNGGVNWTQQLSAGIYNPTNIYFYNKNLGFAANNLGGKLYRTTNAGENWTFIKNQSFFDMHFADNLTGWLSTATLDTSIQKTTDGGLTWITQKVPRGGTSVTLSGAMIRFAVINKDTLWGCGGFIFYPNNRVKSVLYHTTNGGTNWLYQVPDTNISKAYYFINFTNKNNGWAYDMASSGIHTTTGGDTTFSTGIKQLTNGIPDNYKLQQNFPNPFNPITTIKYSIKKSGFITLKVFNIQGKEVANLVSQNQTAGEYLYSFETNNLSSGVYFYTLEINNSKDNFADTKKMMLVK